MKIMLIKMLFGIMCSTSTYIKNLHFLVSETVPLTHNTYNRCLLYE